MIARHLVGSLLGLSGVLLAGCGAPAIPGMSRVASSGTTSQPGSMLVVYPETDCTGTNSAVFIDEQGGFVGAVAPGTVSYLAFPPDAPRVFVVSSRDVLAPMGTRFQRHAVEHPGERVERGIIVEVPRLDAKTCSPSATPTPAIVTYEAARNATRELQWLDVHPTTGTRWLDEHRARVKQLVEPEPTAPAAQAAPAAQTTQTAPAAQAAQRALVP
jgi:hypothetical protein